MLVTGDLSKYSAENRLWQGIPSIETTRRGRIFVTWYSGMDTETMGNFSVLVKSDDGGATFTPPIAAVDVGENARAYDNCLWLDPLGRLWYIWAVMPDNRIEFSICEDPDADVLSWSPVRTIESDVMMNKPTVTKDGAWLFPCAVWKKGLVAGSAGGADGRRESGAFVFETRDRGETFTKLGGVDADRRSFDEHMLLEKQNGDIEMYIRTEYGIAKAVSRDGGATFGKAFDSGLGGPSSRFHIRRLPSGRVLLINHFGFKGRNNLMALLSDDDGATFPHKLLLDERGEVSYPDVSVQDGVIYIVYDRERGARYDKNRDYSYAAREILMAKIKEEDVLAGHLTNSASAVKITVSGLNRQKGIS